MPRFLAPLVVVVFTWSLACSGESESGGGGGGGGASVGAPEPGGPEDGAGRGKSPRGGKAGKRGGGDAREGRGKRGDRGDRGDRGEEPDEPEPEEPEPEPEPEPKTFACYAEGVYQVCDVENKPGTCHDETAKAGGPGSTRNEAERNAVEACDAHMDTLVSAAKSGKGSAEVKRRCEATRCD
jgi:hypothetical protein